MANPFVKDDWDWPFILYAGRVWLHYTDEQVWNLTPRFLQSQLKVHNYLQEAKYGKVKQDTRSNNALQNGYIDQIPGWD